MRARAKNPAGCGCSAGGAPAAAWRRLFASGGIEIGDYRCPHDARGRSAEEVSDKHTIAFPRGGVFVKHVRGEEVLADANQALFFNRGEEYRVSHPFGGGDRCTTLAVEQGLLVEIAAMHHPSAVERPESPFGMTHAPSDPACFMLQRRLLGGLEAGTLDAVAAAEIAIDLIEGALAVSTAARDGAPRRGRRIDTERAHRDLAEATKGVLGRRSSERLTLDEIAAEVHSSAYHLSRVFRREAGLPIHAYLNRLRLRAALDRIAEGATDLTDLALRVGYSDQSHLSNAFRREFGVTPGQWRRELTAMAARESSKNLQV